MKDMLKRIPINSAVFIFKCKDKEQLREILSDEKFKKLQVDILNYSLLKNIRGDFFTNLE